MSDRLFLAVAPSDDVRHGLVTFLDSQLGGKPVPGRVVRPENWHVTLRFLGWIDDEQRDRVSGYVTEHIETAPFTMSFGALGAFPRPQRAAVLWLGVEDGADSLTSLAEVCETAAQSAGLSPEERPFHPHLTLSRIRPHQDVHATIEAVDRFPLRQDVDHLTLFRSHLKRGGAEYEAVDRIDL